MRKTLFEFSKTIISALLIIGIIIGGLVISLYVLKEEAEKTHIKIANLHVKTFSEQIYQTFNYIDLSTDSLVENLNKDKIKNLEKQYRQILPNTPYIRSINILDESKQIISSSNKKNLGLKIELDSFYPKPIFNQQILRFGVTKYGRDIFHTQSATQDRSLTYLPLIKKVIKKDKSYYILITLNSDYFTNRYIDILDNDFAKLEIIRLDGILLYSSKYDSREVGKTINSTKLFENSLEKSRASGIEIYESSQYMSAYQLTDMYPLNISIKIDYEKSLKDWEDKRERVILLVTILVSLVVFLIYIIIYRQNKLKVKELEFHKKQIEEQKKFKVLFEQDIFLASVINDDGSVDNVNQMALDFLGLSFSEIKKRKFYDLDCWQEHDKKWLKETFIEFEKKIDIREELAVYDKNYNERIIEFILKSIEIDGHYKVFAIALDITQKKENEKQLKHAYIVYQNTHDGIMITDENANIIDVNNAFIESSGYTLDEVKGKNPRILKSGKNSHAVYEEMWKSITTKGYWNGELINKTKDDKLYDELLTVNSVHDEYGDLTNYIGIFTNISKQKDQEKKLKEQEHLLFQQSKMAAMGEMLENIAHQWRQPLSVISMSASGISLQKQFGLLEDDYMDRSLQSIIDNTQHLSKTIDDFRNFFRPNKEKNEVVVSEIVERTIKIVSSKFQNRDIKVIKDIDDITIKVYDNELVQVIMNILKNSQDVLENVKVADRYIFIEAKVEENTLFMRLKDSGGGIKDEVIDKIFEPYFTTKHQSQGTGIGLYMSEEIISKHMGGKLYVKNTKYEYEGKKLSGAIFTIEIPL